MTRPILPVLFPPLLLATDGSVSARFAQRLVSAIAQALQTEQQPALAVVVLTVQPRRSSRSRRFLPGKAQAKSSEPSAASHPSSLANSSLQGSEVLLALEPLLDQICAEFPANLAVSAEMRQGRPATEILNYARTLRVGLIAVGYRGSGEGRGLLLGSVASVIARYAPCSVLVARGAALEQQEVRLEHVLLVVQDAGVVRQAIAVTRQLLPAGIRKVTILCIQSPLNASYLFGPFTAPTPSWQLNQSLQQAQREQGEHLLERVKAALSSPTLELQTILQMGEPGPLVCQMAQQQQANLVIIGSDPTRRSLLSPLQNLRLRRKPSEESEASRPVLRNTRLSPTEDYVVHHAPCPVLLGRTIP